jgi:pimeloyl-ACP methyl ester carboxylesterase
VPTVKIDPTLTMFYEDHYFGEPWREPDVVVLIHGVAESSRAWYGWVPHLARELRVLRPDNRGFGRSTVPPPGYAWSTAAFAADLARFLDALGVDRAHIVGAKLGGAIALQFAADYPDRTRTVAVFSPHVQGRNTQGRLEVTSFPDLIRRVGVRGWAAETQRNRLGSDAPQALLDWWTDYMGEADPRVCIEVTSAAGGVDLTPLLPRITAPTVVATAERSGLAGLDVVRAWQQRIPHAELWVLPGDSYHIAAVYPDECAQRVLAFIKRHAAKGAT